MPSASDSQVEDFSRARRRDRRGVLQLLVANHLRAAGRVVGRDDLDPLQARQKSFALRQPLRMRVHLLDVRELRPRKREQVVRHLQQHLGHDRQLVLEQQVVVAVDAAANRVLDRQNAVGCLAAFDGGKHLVEALARHSRRVRTESQCRRFAIRARFALIGNFHS